jgi:general secretion pathway protein H
MRTSAPGINRPRGFTLIELLVVLLIMGLIVGLVTAVVQPGDRARLRVEADRLAQLLDLAAAQSRLTGQSIGWTSDGTGYRFWRITDGGDWAEIGAGDPLRARTLPQGVSISNLRVETMPQQGTMRLVFSPDDFAPAFTLDISLGRARYTLAASPVGELRVLPATGAGDGQVALR